MSAAPHDACLNHVDRDMPILVVDDFSTMRRIIKNALKSLGFENVVEAEDGQAAWNKLQQGEFQFIISDWNMPHMMGIDLLRTVRSSEKHHDIPFLIVTIENQKDALLEATKEGVSNYIIKPFEKNVLQAKMEAIFQK